MRRLVLWVVLWVQMFLIGGCAVAPPTPPVTAWFHDSAFQAPTESIQTDDLFALTADMRRFAHDELAARVRSEGPSRALIDALYRHGQLKLQYDASQTRNAAQAFAARAGNCLSLVIMTAAFAKELGLQVSYQNVIIDDTWSRNGDIAFLNTHINLTLGIRHPSIVRGYDANDQMTVDFLPAEDLRGRRTTAIAEDTVVAMYMNNRAAEALAQGRTDDAYWWVRGAMARDPGFSSPANTLGVVYMHRGLWSEAEQVLHESLQRSPRDRLLLSNLILALEHLGRRGEADELHARLASMEAEAPYQNLQLGIAAMKRGDAQEARRLFRRELARGDDCSECHFWLGLADYRLGDITQARSQIERALAMSTGRDEHAVYAAKLAWLRSVGVQ